MEPDVGQIDDLLTRERPVRAARLVGSVAASLHEGEHALQIEAEARVLRAGHLHDDILNAARAEGALRAEEHSALIALNIDLEQPHMTGAGLIEAIVEPADLNANALRH